MEMNRIGRLMRGTPVAYSIQATAAAASPWGGRADSTPHRQRHISQLDKLDLPVDYRQIEFLPDIAYPDLVDLRRVQPGCILCFRSQVNIG